MVGYFCTIRLMLRSATYWISGSADSSVTSGGAIFLNSVRCSASSSTTSSCLKITCASFRFVWTARRHELVAIIRGYVLLIA